MSRLPSLLVSLCLAGILTCSGEGCDYYLAPTLALGTGVGVFAGRAFHQGEQLEETVCVAFRNRPKEEWMLNNYRYGGYFLSEDEGVAEFGPSMMYNHRERPHLHHFFGEAIHRMQFVGPQIRMFQHFNAYSTYPTNHFKVVAAVGVGEEMFSYYSDDWFEKRGVELKAPTSLDTKTSYSLEELERVGQCMSHVSVRDSDIPGAGKGVFASKAFRRGELVQVTPVLVLAKREVALASDESSVLINYCISRPDSDVSLLPVNYVGLCNHGGAGASAAMEWFYWSDPVAPIHVDPNDLVNAKATSLFLGYRAIRDIVEGEEITIDYGAQWERDWEEYTARRAEFRVLEEPLPLFRRAIDAPEGLFPPHWLLDCIGAACTARDEL